MYRMPVVSGILYSIYMYTGKVACCTCVNMSRKGCLLYLVLRTVYVCTGKVACCTWYSDQCVYVQERLPAVPGILYSVYYVQETLPDVPGILHSV